MPSRSARNLRGVLFVLAGIAFCGVLACSSWAQLSTATILGVVKDSSGAVIPEATVTVTNTETGLSRGTKSATNGAYRFPALPVGTYVVRAEQSGFRPKVQSGLRVAVGDEAVLNFTLDVGAVTEAVSVTAEAPIVNTTSGMLGSLVNEQTLANLPLDGRNFNDLTMLQTGIAENRAASTAGTLNGIQFSSNGAPTRSNLFTIDGTIMNDLHNSGSASSNENTLGVEGIREYRVVTNSFSAEYGMNMGSQVTLVTKNGTNDVHGSLFDFLRNSALDARNWTDIAPCAGCPSKPAFRRNNFGGSVGGPIRPDRLFYFATYEGLRQARGTTDIYTVPTLEARQGIITVLQTVTVAESVKPYLAFWPAPNGENPGQGVARYYRPATEVQGEDYGQGRIDYTVSAADNLFGRYTINDSNDAKPGMIEEVFSQFPTRNQFLTLADNHIFTSALLGTFRGSFSRTHSTAVSTIGLPSNLAFKQGQPMGPLGITGVSSYSGPPGTTPVELNQRILSASADLFLTRGNHSLKYGTLINFYRQYMFNDGGNSPRGSWSFANLPAFLTATPQSFTVLTPGSSSIRTYDYDTLGFYAQDDMKLWPAFTLNLGLRYEFTTQAEEIHGDGAALRDVQHDPSVTLGIPYVNPSKKNFSPRLGFAWDVRGNGRTAVRGGFGLLYDVGTFGTALFIGASATPPLSSVSNVTPAQGLVFGPFPAVPADRAGKELRTIDFHMQQPHLLSYNLTVERQLPFQMGLTVAYAGSRGINIMQTKEGNPAIPLGTPVGRTCVAATPPPAFDPVAPKCWLPNPPRTNPNWDTMEYKTAGSNSWYSSLQVMIQKRLSRGLQFQSAYTWGHAMDETQSQIGVDNSVTSNNSGDDPLNRHADKGSAGFDQRHSWRLSGLYRFPSHPTGGWGKIANGWGLSSSFTWNSGFPFDPTMSTQRSRSLTGGPTGGMKRLDLVPGVKHEDITRGKSRGCIVSGQGIAAGTPLGTPQLFYDPCAFAIPNLGFVGTAGRSILYGPNFTSMSFSLVKDTPLPMLGESGSLQFRTEIFNLLNHPSLGLNAGSGGSFRNVYAARANVDNLIEAPLPGAGQINSTLSKSREIQFALKILF